MDRTVLVLDHIATETVEVSKDRDIIINMIDDRDNCFQLVIGIGEWGHVIEKVERLLKGGN